MDDKTHTFSSPTIFGLLGAANLGRAVYGYDAEPLTKDTFTQISSADASHFGQFTDFHAAAAAGTVSHPVSIRSELISRRYPAGVAGNPMPT